jgi:hypothetical protein
VVLSSNITTGFQWKMTSDERRCYSFFQHRTVPAIIGFFDSVLWEKFVLQLSQSEKAVYHAVVAFSAIHADYEALGTTLANEDLDNSWHRFAIDQCGRSFACLSARSASQDPNLQRVILVCCILFVLSELMRGQYNLAFTHLKNGLRILKDGNHSSDQSRSRGPAIEQCLVEVFAHLNAQSAYFGVEGLPILFDSGLPSPKTDKSEPVFQTLTEAQEAFNPLLSSMSQAYSKITACSPPGIRGDLAPWHFDVTLKLKRFARCFKPFYENPIHQRSIKEQRGADIIYMQQLTLSVTLGSLLNPDGEPLDHDIIIFRELVSLGEAVTSSFTDRPSILLGMGIIAPLFFVSTKCRQPDIRWRAVRALQSWPHREGPWDSHLLARIAMETIRAEESAFTNEPEW